MRHFILLTLRLLEMFFTCLPPIHAKGVIVIANSAGGGKGGNFNQRSGGGGSGESFSMPPPHNIVIAYDRGFFSRINRQKHNFAFLHYTFLIQKMPEPYANLVEKN
jgi:hypothetical protein